MTNQAVPLKLRTIGIGVLIAICLYLSGFLVILTPLPLVYISATAGRKNAIWTAIFSFFLISLFYISVLKFAPISSETSTYAVSLPGLGFASHFPSLAIELFGSGYFLFFLVIAFVLGEAVRGHWGIMKGGISALGVGLFLFLSVVLLIHISGTVHVINGAKEYLEFMVAEIAKLQMASGISNAQTALLVDHGNEIATFIFYIVPSLVFIFALVAVAVNLLLSRRFIRIPHLFAGHVWDVAAFKIPDACVWGAIAAAFIAYAGVYVFHSILLKYLGINIIIALMAVYFFQGLAVIAFLLRRVRSPFLRLLAYVFIIMFFQTVGLLIVGIGLADVWVDFRHRVRFESHNT